MLDPLRTGFYWLYPPVPKHCQTKEGEVMRMRMAWQCFFHFIFFVGMLTMVGFYDMILEVAFGIFAFSIYLTLRELLIMLYLASLICAGLAKIPLFTGTEVDPTVKLLYIFQLIFYFLSFWYVLVTYKDYRFAGGLKGKRHGANVLLKKVGAVVGSVLGTA